MVHSSAVPAAGALRGEATLLVFLCQFLVPPAQGPTAQPALALWINEKWVRDSMQSFGADARVVLPSESRSTTAVVIEDLLKLLLGQPPSANPGEGANTGFSAGDNIMSFFGSHPRVIRAITSITLEGAASSESDNFVVVPETTRPHCRVYGSDFMHIVLDPKDSRHHVIMQEARNVGRYIIFPILEAVHYVEFVLDLWERKVYVLDGMQPGDGAAAGMSSTTTRIAQQVRHAPSPE